MNTIDSPSSLRRYIEEQIFSATTEKLAKDCPDAAAHPAENRKWCVDALWRTPMQLTDNLRKLAEMELEWRRAPERTELRPSLL